jgi:hypothetical protein
MRRHLALLAAAAASLAFAGAAFAHHSFAVFFEAEGSVSATGAVTEFNFRNPHATIAIESANEAGEAVAWRGETNSPSILRRRGWTQQSIAIGETVTMEGWPARDGTRYMRIRSVTREDGSLVGSARFAPSDD